MPRLPKVFRAVFRYRMQDGKPRDENVLDKELLGQSSVVYARTYRGEVVYVGSTDGIFRRRLRAHVHGISKSTRGMAPKFREWAEGKTITIFAYKPPPVTLLGRKIEVHRGLEAALISEFRSRNKAAKKNRKSARAKSKPWFVARI